MELIELLDELTSANEKISMLISDVNKAMQKEKNRIQSYSMKDIISNIMNSEYATPYVQKEPAKARINPIIISAIAFINKQDIKIPYFNNNTILDNIKNGITTNEEEIKNICSLYKLWINDNSLKLSSDDKHYMTMFIEKNTENIITTSTKKYESIPNHPRQHGRITIDFCDM